MPLKPDPRVTSEMVRFIDECEKLEPEDTGALYPYADKSGYHNTVERNLARWPGEYSTRLADDLRGNRRVCRAFDWISESARTRGDRTVMNRYGRRLRDAYLRRDPRYKGWREVLTQVDAGQPEGYNVGPGGWYTRTPDLSHDYHHHFSVLTAYVGHWPTYAGMLSILADEPLTVWQAGKSRYLQEGMDDMQRDLWALYTVLAVGQSPAGYVPAGAKEDGAALDQVQRAAAYSLASITAKLDMLLGRPALVVTEDLVDDLADRLAVVLAGRPDNGLTDADKPVIKAAVAELFREGIAETSAG